MPISNSTKSTLLISPPACKRASGPPSAWFSFISRASTVSMEWAQARRSARTKSRRRRLCRPARSRTQRQPSAWTSPRHPHPGQGQHRNARSHQHHRRFARSRRLARTAGRHRGRPPPSSRRHLLGKTNLSEWANFRSTHATSGWSGRGGQTRNPYALDRNPSGSSSGSGAATAASLCAAAIGTETDGSVTSPSSINGICGIKPTVGLVSRSGIIPISASQDTAGPMARTVRDLAILLGVMADAEKVAAD